MDLSISGDSSATISGSDCVDLDIDRADFVDSVRAVPRDSAEDIVDSVFKVSTVFDRWQPMVASTRTVDVVDEGGGKQCGEQHHHDDEAHRGA